MKVFVKGRGAISSEELKVDKAVSEYDERLLFGRNEETGQYCIFIKMPADFDGPSIGLSKVLPILGFDDIPHPETALRRLYAADTMRHGEQILHEMNRRNEEANEPVRKAAEDASGQAAEALEWGTRKMGAHPNPRIFVPGKDE